MINKIKNWWSKYGLITFHDFPNNDRGLLSPIGTPPPLKNIEPNLHCRHELTKTSLDALEENKEYNKKLWEESTIKDNKTLKDFIKMKLDFNCEPQDRKYKFEEFTLYMDWINGNWEICVTDGISNWPVSKLFQLGEFVEYSRNKRKICGK